MSIAHRKPKSDDLLRELLTAVPIQYVSNTGAQLFWLARVIVCRPIYSIVLLIWCGECAMNNWAMCGGNSVVRTILYLQNCSAPNTCGILGPLCI
jgi:hypothetical protein